MLYGFWGVCRKMCGICVCTFLQWLKFEKYICEKVSWFSLLHTTNGWQGEKEGKTQIQKFEYLDNEKSSVR